jgi:uncharacterized membrane protein YeaQ/YmgE (transglycosylase-associated protein family)
VQGFYEGDFMIVWIAVWIVAGVVVGLLGNWLAQKRGAALMPDLALGVLGAGVGGWIFSAFGGFDVRAAVVAVLSAVLLLFISHAPDASFAGRKE